MQTLHIHRCPSLVGTPSPPQTLKFTSWSPSDTMLTTRHQMGTKGWNSVKPAVPERGRSAGARQLDPTHKNQRLRAEHGAVQLSPRQSGGAGPGREQRREGTEPGRNRLRTPTSPSHRPGLATVPGCALLLPTPCSLPAVLQAHHHLATNPSLSGFTPACVRALQH